MNGRLIRRIMRQLWARGEACCRVRGGMGCKYCKCGGQESVVGRWRGGEGLERVASYYVIVKFFRGGAWSSI